MPTALITGGTSGIGRASAALLRDRGWDVAVTGRDPASVEAARRALGTRVLVLAADARSLPETDAVMNAVRERFGTLDLLFLNAGVSRPAPIGEVGEAAFDDLIAINFKGQFFTLQKALELMNDGGSIVLTIGSGVTRGIVGGTVTAASRGALWALVPSLALELAPRRIRVNAVSPGAIDTPIWDKLGVSGPAREAMAAGIPFGRFGTADEIAETVAFLASPAAGYITGQEIVIAGGA